MNSMFNTTFHFSSQSTWWILLCAFIATLYSLVLYYPPSGFAKPYRFLLTAARWVLVFILMLFLFSPLFTSKSSREEKPMLFFLQDNSSSILASNRKSYYQNEYLNQLKDFKAKLADKFDVSLIKFGESLALDQADPNYQDQQTAIAAAMQQVATLSINKNVAAVVLATDGIANQGQDPYYESQKLALPIYTVCMGDPRVQKDAAIKDVQANDVVFKDTYFPVNIQLKAFSLAGKSTDLIIFQNGVQKKKLKVNINKNDFFATIPFELFADQVGLQTYTVKLNPINGEQNSANNTFYFYVNVLANKQKVLLYANAAHPDLAAFSSIIKANEQYELTTLIAEDFAPKDLAKFQLLILHQLPSGNNATFDLLSQAKALNIPVFYIVGPQTYIDLYNRQNTATQILNANSKLNEVTALFNDDFYYFNLTPETKNLIAQLPPLNAPFGSYQTQANAQVLLKQQVGSMSTNMPLLSFNIQNGYKSASLFGDGIWRWRLVNYQLANNTAAVEELIQKTIQFLVLQSDNRKFNVKIQNNNIIAGEEINFNATLYNDSYQAITGPDVQLKIKNSQGKNFDFVFSKNNINYELNAGAFPAGVYSFSAKTQLGAVQFVDKGNFTIRANQLEQMDTRANFDLLNNISKQSGAISFQDNQLSALADTLLFNQNYKRIAYETTSSKELIDLNWVLGLLLTLASLEWFGRKRLGRY
ncbi:MAG: hypothetical protein RI934_597 [Bacteroidota bacterium]|jgi:hypothetical protein